MKKTIIIIITIIVISIVGTYIYFVSGVSSVSSPIKKYEYAGSSSQLLSSLQKLSSKSSNFKFKITDTTGTPSNRAIYTTITIRNNNTDSIEYGLKCEQNNSDTKPTTVISVVEAYDITNNLGGYIADAKGVKHLVEIFESKLLLHLKEEDIELKVL